MKFTTPLLTRTCQKNKTHRSHSRDEGLTVGALSKIYGGPEAELSCDLTLAICSRGGDLSFVLLRKLCRSILTPIDPSDWLLILRGAQ